MRFGGGTNEVLRDIIAQRGHGMPSYGRYERHESDTHRRAARVRRVLRALLSAESPVEPGACPG